MTDGKQVTSQRRLREGLLPWLHPHGDLLTRTHPGLLTNPCPSGVRHGLPYPGSVTPGTNTTKIGQ